MCDGMNGLVHHCKGRLGLFAYEILLWESLTPSLRFWPCSKSSTDHYYEATSAQHLGIVRKHLFLTCRIVSSNRLSALASIVLPCLCAGIRVPRSKIIARRLLQRIGLRLRALRIELFAEFALAAL
jgi:hypothetical protein